ncbi:MAG: hypothetical protein PHR06_07595 [Candidatus Cloacimonetes bacterium]|nr:hypothetical protein [Candidatus Cloacimonadota bacterium]
MMEFTKVLKISAIILLSFFITFISAVEKEDKIATTSVSGDTILVVFNIPEGMYQDFDQDLFFIETEETKGITLMETIYPEPYTDEEGYQKFKGTITLKKPFKVAEKYLNVNIPLNICIGYQFCYGDMCDPPVEIEETLIIKLGEKK